MNKVVLLLSVFVLPATAFTALAAVTDSTEIHGFVNQGFVYSPDNPYFGDSRSLSGDFREIGVNAFWEVSDKLRIAGQVLSRKAGEADNGKARIDFLLLDYHVYADQKLNFGVRLGRTKTPYGLYNATRDVPHSRPVINVPSSVYFDSYRDVMLSSDGINLYGGYAGNLGSLDVELFGGQRSMDNDHFEQFFFDDDIEGHFDKVKIKGMKLSYRPLGTRDLHFAASVLVPRFELRNAPMFNAAALPAVAAELSTAITDLPVDFSNYTDYLTDTHIKSVLQLYSVQYGLRDWLLTAEYMKIHTKLSEIEVLHQPLPEYSFSSRGYYMQAEWFTSPTLHTFWRYEHLQYDTDDPHGRQRVADGRSVHGHLSYGRGHTLGLRWHISADLSLSTQFTRNRGTAWLPVFNGRNSDELAKDWDVYALQLTFNF